MDTKVKLNTARLDELMAGGASSAAIRTLIVDSFLTLQQLGIIVKSDGSSAQPSKSEPASSAQPPP